MAKKSPAKELPTQQIKMFMTHSGKLFSEKDLKRYEIPQSKQVDEVDFKTLQIIEPPFNLEKLMMWMDTSVAHNSAIRTKVQDAVGIGWDIVKSEESGNDSDRAILMEFFSKVNESEDITIMSEKVMTDFEGTGNGYIEVARDAEGKVNALYHIPAVSIRVHKDGKRYIQKVGGRTVWFKSFGMTESIDKDTGETRAVENVDLIANEIIHLKMYTWRSSHYGLPEWLPAVFPMFGEQKEKEYNLNFFANFGIPAYAVIFEGITELNPDLEDDIKKYFEHEIQGNPHKTMVFALPKNGKVTFEPLNVDPKEASFRVFRRDNRDDVLSAHRVPPYRAGIVIAGSLGGTVTAEIDRIYLSSVIDPRQLKYEWVLNNLIIHQGFEIQGWHFQFKDIRIDDRKLESEIHTSYFNLGVKTPNEIRADLGLERYEGGDFYYLAGGAVPIEMAGSQQGQTFQLSLPKKKKTKLDIEEEKLQAEYEAELTKEFARQGKELIAYLNANNILEKLRADAMKENPEIYDKRECYEVLDKKISAKDMKKIEMALVGWGKKVKPEIMAEIIKEFNKRAGNLGGSKAMAKLGLNIKFDLKNKKLLEEIAKRGDKIVGKIAKSTLSDFRDIIARKFYEEGAGAKETAKAIGGLFKETYKNRAMTIARTESGIAMESMQNESYKKNKVDMKQWISTLDDRTRTKEDGEFDHVRANGEKVKVGEMFVKTGEPLEHPLDPNGSPGNIINCRCTSSPVVDEAINVGDAWFGE